MIRVASSGEANFEGIVVYSFSRFTRNPSTQFITDELLNAKGIRVVSCTEKLPEDADTAHMLKSMFGVINDHNSRLNSKTVSDRLFDTFANGYFTGSTPPFGYKSIVAPESSASKQKKVLVIDKDSAEIVKLIFRLSLHGETGKPFGLKKIATYLNERGITKKSNKEWNFNKVHKVLTNRCYIGEIKFGLKPNRKYDNKPPLIGKIPAIIEVETFNLVREGLKSRAPKMKESKADRSTSLLTGLIKCGYCGSNMVIQTGKSGKYRYYKCSERIRKRNNICACPNLKKEEIENAVLETIHDEVLTTEHIVEVMANLRNHYKENVSVNQREVLRLQRKLSTVTEKLNNIYEMISNNSIEQEETLSKYISQHQNNRIHLLAELEDLKKKESLPLKNFGKVHSHAFCEAVKNVLVGDDVETTKSYIQAIVSKIVVSEKGAFILGDKFRLAAQISRYDPEHPEVGVPSLITNWRRGRDSNPRYAINVYTLSRRAPSATRPPLQYSLNNSFQISNVVAHLRAQTLMVLFRFGNSNFQILF